MNDTSQKAFSQEFPAGLPLEPIFAALPGAYVLFSPQFLILAVSDGFADISYQERDALLGKHVFEVFPDNPQLPEASGVQNLKFSLEQVLTTGKAHQMPLQHYDIPDPEQAGRFLERYWRATNTPVLDGQGQVVSIYSSYGGYHSASQGPSASCAEPSR